MAEVSPQRRCDRNPLFALSADGATHKRLHQLGATGPFPAPTDRDNQQVAAENGWHGAC
jgi:hypothetical protein